VAHFNLALLLAYLHFPLSNGYLIVEVLDYSVLPCFFLFWDVFIYFFKPVWAQFNKRISYSFIYFS